MKSIDDILNSRVNGRFAVRKVRISENKANQILNSPAQTTGCDPNKYNVTGTGDSCHCVSFATRAWFINTGSIEDFRPVAAFGRAPSELTQYIIGANTRSRNDFTTQKIIN